MVKKILYIGCFSLCLFFFGATHVFAIDYASNSNMITTRVGSPHLGTDCPIPHGVVTNGSRLVPVNGYGHCDAAYVAQNPNLCPASVPGGTGGPGMDGTPHAMDIAANPGDPVYLPKINDHTISWTFANGHRGSGGNEEIQDYAGKDEQTGDQYYLTLHHTEYGSGASGTHSSGEIGARICQHGCYYAPHVHVELSTVTSSGSHFVEAPSYFCNAVTGNATSTPSASSSILSAADLKDKIANDYNIAMNGFDQQHLQWAYDMFKELSKTQFTEILRQTSKRTVISVRDASLQNSVTDSPTCSISLIQNQTAVPNNAGESEQEIFDITLTHELGHIIQDCAPNRLSLYAGDPHLSMTHAKIYQDHQGITQYSRSAGTPGCPSISDSGSDSSGYRSSENYAEMIAYYLHPGVKQKNVCGNGRKPNPFDNGANSQFRDLAEQILGKYP